jgi:hypothetical protein
MAETLMLGVKPFQSDVMATDQASSAPAFHWRRLARFVVLGWPIPLVILVNAPGYGSVAAALCVGVQSVRLSAGRQPTGAAPLNDRVWSLIGAVIVMWATQWFAGVTHEIFLIGSLALIFHLAVATSLAWPMLFEPTGPSMNQRRAGRLVETTTSAPQLRAMISAIEQSADDLPGLPLFNVNQPDLATAWDRRNVDRIESILKAGDALNRSSWQQAIERFNKACATVDIARAALRTQLTAAERDLAPFNIDYSPIEARASKHLEGTAPVATLKKHFTQKLNYGQGIGRASAQAVSGQMPWQFAALAVAGMMVMHAIGHSRLLRQLKEMEGTVSANTVAARGDLSLMSTLLRGRVLPQLHRSVDLFSQIEKGRALLQAQSGTRFAHDQAMELAYYAVEGRHLLQTMAAD